MAHNFYVFIGKPGSGKSTLIKQVFSDNVPHLDVAPFVKAHAVDGFIPEEKTFNGYCSLYDYCKTIITEKPSVILELGTNHAAFNIQQLCSLQEKHKIIVFLCHARVETCFQRVMRRGDYIDPEALQRRMQRDFPNAHIALLQESQIPYQLIDTEHSLDRSIKIIRQYL